MLLVAACLQLVGCATAPPSAETRFDLKSIDRAVAPMQSIDSTGAFSAPPSLQSMKRMHKGVFEPALNDVLLRRLAAEKLPSLENKTIDIRVAHVDAYVVAQSRPSMPTTYIANAPIGVNIIGNLIGLGLVSLLSPADKLSFIATLEIKVDDQIYASQGGATSHPREAQRAVVDSIEFAIANLLSRIRPPSIETDNSPLTEPPGTPK